MFVVHIDLRLVVIDLRLFITPTNQHPIKLTSNAEPHVKEMIPSERHQTGDGNC